MPKPADSNRYRKLASATQLLNNKFHFTVPPFYQKGDMGGFSPHNAKMDVRVGKQQDVAHAGAVQDGQNAPAWAIRMMIRAQNC